jgi:hypothetical protein
VTQSIDVERVPLCREKAEQTAELTRVGATVLGLRLASSWSHAEIFVCCGLKGE